MLFCKGNREITRHEGFAAVFHLRNAHVLPTHGDHAHMADLSVRLSYGADRGTLAGEGLPLIRVLHVANDGVKVADLYGSAGQVDVIAILEFGGVRGLPAAGHCHGLRKFVAGDESGAIHIGVSRQRQVLQDGCRRDGGALGGRGYGRGLLGRSCGGHLSGSGRAKYCHSQ